MFCFLGKVIWKMLIASHCRSLTNMNPCFPRFQLLLSFVYLFKNKQTNKKTTKNNPLIVSKKQNTEIRMFLHFGGINVIVCGLLKNIVCQRKAL